MNFHWNFWSLDAHYKMSVLRLVTNGIGADPEHPYVEALAASNDTGKRQIVTINIICMHGLLYSDLLICYGYHIYRQKVKESYSSCLKGFCFTSFIFPGMTVTEDEWHYIITCGSRSSLQLVKTTMRFRCAWSLQSRGFGLEGNEVRSSGSSCLHWAAWARWQKSYPKWSLAETVSAKHPFGCTGATSRARIPLQLLWNTEQLKKKKEKNKTKNPWGVGWKPCISCLLLLSQDLHRDFDRWFYCLFIRWATQYSPQFSRIIRGKKSTWSYWISYLNSSSSCQLYIWKWA